MAENYPADPANPNLPPQQPDPSAAPAPAPKRRRKRWPWVIVGILLLLILLVALAPTLISSGPGKSFIVGKINNSLNGKLDVADLSIGWLSGVTLNGVKIDDQQGRRVLEIASVRVPISLIGAARGKYDLGDTVIDKPNLVNLEIYEDGSTNLGKLMKDSGGNATPPAAPPDQTSPQPTQPTKIPDIKGKITINQARATVSGPAVRSPIHLESGDVVVNIPNINSEITNDAKFVYRVGQSPPGTITIVGAIDAIENNIVNVDKLAADEKIQITSADLAGIEPFLQSPGAKTTLAGIASGALQLKSAGFQSCGLDGQLAVTNFAYGGDALKGDIYKSSNVALPISIATSSAGADTLIKIQTLKLETDHALVDLSGEATRGALTNLAKREKPGAKGQLALAVITKDMPGLFNLLRNTLGLQKDVKITSGEFKTRVEVALTPENAVVKQSLYAVAAGQNGTQPVKLEPVYLDTAVSIPDIGDLAVHLKSGFATINGSGASLASLNIKGDADLGRLRSQIGQFTDLGKLDLSGTADFEVTSKGDLRKPESESDLSAILNLRNVIVRGLEGKPEINQPRVALVTTATLVSGREGGETVDRVKTASVTFQTGEATAPVVDMLLTLTNVTITKLSVEKIDLTRLNVPDLAVAQQRFAAFLPDSVRFTSGGMTGVGSGSYQNDTLQFDYKSQLKNLSLTDNNARAILTNENADIAANGKYGNSEAIIQSAAVNTSFARANVTETLLKLGGDTFDMVQRAKVQIAIPDIAKTMAVADAFSPPSTQPATTQPLKIGGGALVNMDVRREGDITHVTIPQIAASKVSLTRGDRRFDFAKPINLQLAADLGTKKVPTTASTQPVEQVDQIRITQLAGDLGGLATVATPENVILTNLTGEQPSANGKIALNGALEPLTRLLSVIQGADPMPYRGDYALAQNVRTDAGKIALVGDLTVNKLIVLGADGKPAVTEDQVVLANNIDADTNTKTATINALKLDMPASKALGLNVKGAIADWQKQRQFQNVVVEVPHDLEKLWPIIRPMLSPETQASLKDMKLAGNRAWVFNISGSYPAAERWQDSIKALSANGAIGFDLLDTNGANITYKELPITLAGGQLTTLYANVAKEKRHPAPGTFNGGPFDLGGVLLDLTQDTPRLSIGKNQVLVKDAKINALLSQALGKYFNAFFAKADDADGMLDVTIDYCDKVPLGGEQLKTDKIGRAKMLLSLRNMRIINPVAGQMVKSVLKQLDSVRELAQLVPGVQQQLGGPLNESNTLQGEIRNGEIILANGRITQNITMALTDPQKRGDVVATSQLIAPVVMPLKISGDLTLATQLQNLDVTLPSQLIGRAIGSRDVANILEEKFPNGIPFKMGGTPENFSMKPLVSVADVIRPLVLSQLARKFGGDKGGNVGGIIGDVLGGRKPTPAPQTTQPSNEPKSPLGGLLERFTKPPKEATPPPPPAAAPTPAPTTAPAPAPAPARKKRAAPATSP